MAENAVSNNWIPETSTFGARLALVRWRMGWNVKEAADECHLTPSSWGNWEAGSMPRNYVEVVNRIVLRTRVNKYWLMDGAGSPEPDNSTEPPEGIEPSTYSLRVNRSAD